jgi:cytochrome c553
MAKVLSDEEIRAAADYYAAVKWVPNVKVVESATVPKFLARGGMYVPAEEGGNEPLGNRIIELPNDAEVVEYLRDPSAMWTAYVPVGSVMKGATLATTGVATAADGSKVPGRTVACSVCHGPDLMGVGAVPGIAGRPPSYIVRQLNDIRQGARQSGLMAAVVAELTTDDMVALGAYIGSREVR